MSDSPQNGHPSMPEPSNADIMQALQGFGGTYHDLHLLIERTEEASKHERLENKAERTSARNRFDALFGRIGEMASKMEAQFQRAWQEIDELSGTVDEMKGTVEGVKDAIIEMNTRHERQIMDLDSRYAEVLTRLTTDEQRLDNKRQRIEALEVLTRAQQLELERLAAAIAARPTPGEAHATYAGVQQIRAHLGLTDAAETDHGR